jgi:Zn-dependent membrane protease YugP
METAYILIISQLPYFAVIFILLWEGMKIKKAFKKIVDVINNEGSPGEPSKI